MSVEAIVLQVKKRLIQRRAQRFGRNNRLLQKGKFDLTEEWEQRKADTQKKLREISERLYPEKYKHQRPQ